MRGVRIAMHERNGDAGLAEAQGLHRRGAGLGVLVHIEMELLHVVEGAILAKMRIFRVPEFLGAALMLGLLGTLLLFVSRSF